MGELAPEWVEELWAAAEAERCDLARDELALALRKAGEKLNWNLPPGADASAAQRLAFLRGLKLAELALAQACALGRERAWERFLKLYRGPLTAAAVAICGSATEGHELADGLYGELYGLRERGGQRHSPLLSYSGRGSLMGWLRTTLAQRHVDRHRKTYRESPLGEVDAPGPEPVATPAGPELVRLAAAVERTLSSLGAEGQFLLAAYFLDGRTLLEIGKLLKVHEATISRRLKRLTGDLRAGLLRQLETGGLSRRAAEEALGTDPRDVEVNLRNLLGSLQNAQAQAFSKGEGLAR